MSHFQYCCGTDTTDTGFCEIKYHPKNEVFQRPPSPQRPKVEMRPPQSRKTWAMKSTIHARLPRFAESSINFGFRGTGGGRETVRSQMVIYFAKTGPLFWPCFGTTSWRHTCIAEQPSMPGRCACIAQFEYRLRWTTDINLFHRVVYICWYQNRGKETHWNIYITSKMHPFCQIPAANSCTTGLLVD